MPRVFLLVSYPKSGNTWLRALLTALRSERADLDINDMGEIALLARKDFDAVLLVESSSLTAAEIAEARPAFMRRWAREKPSETLLVKVHEANLPYPGTVVCPYPPDSVAGVVYLIRDPRDVAVSLASHYSLPVDEVIGIMAKSRFVISRGQNSLSDQLPQLASTWSAHVASWLDARDFNLHPVRYEELLADTPARLMEIARFLDLNATPETVARAVSSASFQNLQRQEAAAGFRERPDAMPRFFRRGEAGGWHDSLTPSQVARIEHDHRETMIRLGYLTAVC